MMKEKTLVAVTVLGRTWFDKPNGNSYFATRTAVIWDDGSADWYRTPFEYGYGNQFMVTALENLVRKGVLSDVNTPSGARLNARVEDGGTIWFMPMDLRIAGVTFIQVLSRATKAEVKAWGKKEEDE